MPPETTELHGQAIQMGPFELRRPEGLRQAFSTGNEDRRIARLATPFAAAIALLSMTGGASATSRPDPSSIGRGSGRPSRATVRNVTEAALIALLDQSEAGELDPLRTARASIADPGIRAVVDARLAAARLDLPGTRAAVVRAERSRLAPRWRALGLAIRAGVGFAAGDYAAAARDCEAWLSLPDGTDPIRPQGDIEQMLAVADALARLPRQRVAHAGPGSTPTWRDKATLVRTAVAIDGHRQEVVLDTGANLSVLAESTAKALGLDTTGGASVRSSSRDAVPVRLAFAIRLEIAGTSLHDVAFLVMADADLRLPLPGGYDIPAIIGFPVFRALGRLTFSPDALVTGRAAARLAPTNLAASGSDLFVRARVNGIDVPLHLDTGASSTSLSARFAAAHPDLVAGLERRSTRSAGAGGASEGKAAVLLDAAVRVGGVATVLPAIEVAEPTGAAAGNFGTLGQDVLRTGGGYTIDFSRMSLTLDPGPRLAPEGP